MDTVYTILIFLFFLLIIGVPYWIKISKRNRSVKIQYQKAKKSGLNTPVTLHPHIDILSCIGCASCVMACPENVLGIVDGKSAIINGLKCISHGLCADVCPVGGIELKFGTPRLGEEIPYYNENHETNIEGLYIVGELGGIGLIKNAVSQAQKSAFDILTKNRKGNGDIYDLIIVGAGPAGLSSSLHAKANNLKYITLEQDEIGGTILHYPKQKLVLTSPVELPLYGKLRFSEITKENLLDIWKNICQTYELNLMTNKKVESIEKQDNIFIVKSGNNIFYSVNLILALGRRGSPRKLGIPGENLPKVMYKLADAEAYRNKNLLVIGGGDSAIEATVGLARQSGNKVTLSYRRDSFVRIKEKNEKNINELIKSKRINLVFSSEAREIKNESAILAKPDSVIEIPNDYIFIFAGGEMPAELLKKAGIKLRTRESE